MPTVSIIVPCYNEEGTIQLLLEALYRQSYPRPEMEIVIADGISDDNTRQQIETFSKQYPDLQVKVVDNPPRAIPCGLNRAIAASSGTYIVRLDAHSVPRSDYVSRSVAALESGLGENVGGVWEIQPAGVGWQARSIAAAAAHPLGVGDARYRYTDKAQPVDTVPFGAYRRTLVDQIGGYDETLLTNEDYEFNVRIRNRGGKIWLDPSIRSTYFARASYSQLARQYWRYGYWKARMLTRYPSTLRWRQALPPLFILSLAGLTMLYPWFEAARILLLLITAAYLSIVFLVSARTAFQRRDFAMLVGLPIAICIMHMAWGSAFLWSMARMRTYKKEARS
jgi:succinoglycan biosynthesis protein ExoA